MCHFHSMAGKHNQVKSKVVTIIAEDDPGHAALIIKNLKRTSFSSRFLHFKNGQETLDFLFRKGRGPVLKRGTPYVLLLDLKMPKIDGIEVLQRIKNDGELCKIPVTIVTTMDDPREVERCHNLGCSRYITKPVDYDKFADSMKQLGLFLSKIEIPTIN